MGSTARLVMMGVREPGCAEFRLTVYGNAGRQLPPAVLIASLVEFRTWLLRGQSPATPASASPQDSAPV
jgi:hypothetical protein